MVDSLRIKDKEPVKSFIMRAGYWYKIIDRCNDYIEEQIEKKKGNLIPLTPYQKQLIKNVWDVNIPYLIDNLDYRWYEFYNGFCKDEEDIVNFIPDNLYYKFIDEYICNPARATQLDDKQLYKYLFHDVKQPETLFTYCNDIYTDGDGKIISLDDALGLACLHNEVVLKSSFYSSQGEGVSFVKMNDGGITLHNEMFKDKFLIKKSRKGREIICQTVVSQSGVLDKINPNCVCTLRIVTYVSKNGVDVLSCILRMGNKVNRVDNASAGGVFCGIDNGVTKDIAYDTTGKRYNKHPNGNEFAGIKIPSYDKIEEIVKILAVRVSTATRMVSWDFAIDENDEPVMIEANMASGELDFHQMCNGPLFNDSFNKILKEMATCSFTLNQNFGR